MFERSSLTSLDPIINLSKRRGFIFPAGEIYGGTGGIYDFGPLGVLLKNNIKAAWWRTFVQARDDIVGLDTALISKREVFKASGHVDTFSDPLIECKHCHTRYRADQEPFNLPSTIEGADHTLQAKVNTVACPNCGKRSWTAPRRFNMMFQMSLGATEDSDSTVYLRPETAQGIFTNFKNVLETSRQKIPFGIGQIGKSFRNEIQTGNFIFRLREFEIAELEYFVQPGTEEEWFERWVTDWESFLYSLGIAKDNIRNEVKAKADLAHYSKATTDLHYRFPFGFDELAGVASRTDFDLKNHIEHSGKDLAYFDQETNEQFVPFVIEPTLGIERLFVALLCEAYREYPGGRNVADVPNQKLDTRDQRLVSGTEIVLHLKPELAPFTVAVLPLMKKEGMPELAKEIARELRSQFMVAYDESASIGRRYRRQDEIGTPWCVTVDFDSMKDQTVTIRDRDTMKQERIKIAELKKWVVEKMV